MHKERCENRCRETLEVMQTSAGQDADPSTTKQDLYADFKKTRACYENTFSCQVSEVSRSAYFKVSRFFK